MNLGPPLLPILFLGGLASPLLNCGFCLNKSNTISIGPTVKVNRLMKKMLQIFGSILTILFVIYNL